MPSVLRHLGFDDLRRLDDHVWNPRHRSSEVIRVEVRLVGLLGFEPFDDDELVRIVDVARPLAKDVARCVPGGLGEVVAAVRKALRVSAARSVESMSRPLGLPVVRSSAFAFDTAGVNRHHRCVTLHP